MLANARSLQHAPRATTCTLRKFVGRCVHPPRSARCRHSIAAHPVRRTWVALRRRASMPACASGTARLAARRRQCPTASRFRSRPRWPASACARYRRTGAAGCRSPRTSMAAPSPHRTGPASACHRDARPIRPLCSDGYHRWPTHRDTRNWCRFSTPRADAARYRTYRCPRPVADSRPGSRARSTPHPATTTCARHVARQACNGCDPRCHPDASPRMRRPGPPAGRRCRRG